MGLSLAQALRLAPAGPLDPAAGVVAFVGAGGKTTAIFHLARELKPPVVVATTTHLGTWQIPLGDHHLVAATQEDVGAAAFDGVTIVTGPLDSSDRFGPVPEDALKRLHALCAGQHRYLLIEADGARQKPLKAPASHEPAIPSFASIVVVVAGMSGLDQPLSEDTVHRPELFAALSGLRVGEPVTPDALARVLTRPEGGNKGIPASARRVALLNQAGSEALQARAHSMVPQLLTSFDSVLVADLQGREIHAVHEPVAGIVLAAGGASRFGRSKVLLDWRGQPFVRAVASTALSAGLHPVVVVAGADADRVTAAVNGLPVIVVHNADWQSGQASSIRAGVRSVPSSTGAAVFLLADQPQLHFDVITALVDTHAASLSPVVAPLVMMEQRANPVLFDKLTFPDLLALQGDVGGRAVFSKHRVEYMPWHDDRLLLDVDTEADYRRLIEDDTL